MMRHMREVMNASHLTKRFALRERQKRACTKTAKDS